MAPSIISAQDSAVTSQFKATGTDQYGQTMENVAVEWSVSENGWGVAIGQDGNVNVPSQTSGEVTMVGN